MAEIGSVSLMLGKTLILWLFDLSQLNLFTDINPSVWLMNLIAG